MIGLWREMAKNLSSNQSMVVATIFEKSGSAPRTVGAKMIIKADGSIVGTIGGGKLEAEIIKLSQTVFTSRTPLVQYFNLSGSGAASMSMICGGNVEVLLDYVNAKEKTNLEICQSIVDVLFMGDRAWLINVIETMGSNNSRQQCLIKKDGTIIGRVPCDRELMNKILSGSSKIHSETVGNQRLVIEQIRNTGTLYLFGAGHVSQQLAHVADLVGFSTIVIDDRREYANQERFPKSKIIVLDSLAEPLPELDFDEDSYLVTVTRGHLHDKRVLEQLLRKPAAYIGMMGSIRKREFIYRDLAEKGFTGEDFQRVHCPIGIEIESDSPEEIAISIVAELIKVRAERKKCLNKELQQSY
jgi:xanthine dehydrogenase accessory factor